MDRYAVIGNPIEHSMSPRIHAWFAEQTGQHLEYGRLLAPLDGFVEVVDRFFRSGGCGVNVTVPFKAEAAAWVDDLDPLARAAGAVNTIKGEGSRRIGFNTDGIGLVRDITINQGVALRAARILVLGAGGAACGAVGPLLGLEPEELVVANRSPARAEQLVTRFPTEAARGLIRWTGFRELPGRFDVVINATSAGLGGSVPDIGGQFVADAFCYDMVYGHSTAFCTWAARMGAARVSDGIGMLVEQAAEAFRIWRDIRPGTRQLLQMLRDERSVIS